MSECEKCGKTHKPTMNRIFICKDCYKKAIKKLANIPLNEYVEKQTKQIKNPLKNLL